MAVTRRSFPKLGKRLAKRRRFLLSILGASIVLGTFIAREVFREHEKEIADGILSAELLFQMKALSGQFDARVDQLQYGFDTVLGYMKSKDRQPEPGIDFASAKRPRELVVFYNRQIVTDTNSAYSNLDGNEQQLEMISLLLSRLPHARQENIRWQSLRDETTSLSYRLREFSESTRDVSRLPPGMKWLPEMTDEQALALAEKRKQQEDYLVNLLNSGGETGGALNDLTGDVIKAAKAQREIAERRYTFFTILSFFLYPPGVVIAIIGQYYGAETANVE